MYREAGAVERIKMCGDCRVAVQFEAADEALAGPARPRPRTTDDYE